MGLEVTEATATQDAFEVITTVIETPLANVVVGYVAAVAPLIAVPFKFH